MRHKPLSVKCSILWENCFYKFYSVYKVSMYNLTFAIVVYTFIYVFAKPHKSYVVLVFVSLLQFTPTMLFADELCNWLCWHSSYREKSQDLVEYFEWPHLINEIDSTHYDDVTWTSYSLKSPIIDCLFNRLYGPTSKKHPHYWPFVRGIHRWPVNSPHKGPVTPKKASMWRRHHDNDRQRNHTKHVVLCGRHCACW